jgi:hypothetical protein
MECTSLIKMGCLLRFYKTVMTCEQLYLTP